MTICWSLKRVYMHMMPWFQTPLTNNGTWGSHWTMATRNPDIHTHGKRNIASHYYPIIGLYDSSDPDVIDWQLGLMKLSGISGVLIDWYGTTHVYDFAINLHNSEAIIAGTLRNCLQFGIIYEDFTLKMARDAGAIHDLIAQGQLDMKYIQQHYFNLPNYIHYENAPLLLNFGSLALNGVEWDKVFVQLEPKPTFLTLWYDIEKGGSMAKGEFQWIYTDFMDGLTNFWKYRNVPIKFAVAYPGFHPYYQYGGWPGPNWTIPVSPTTFEHTLDLALNNCDDIQLATWNDYGEGTIIEPTTEFGYHFLSILQNKMHVNHNQHDLQQLTQLFHQIKLHQKDDKILHQLKKKRHEIVCGTPPPPTTTTTTHHTIDNNNTDETTPESILNSTTTKITKPTTKKRRTTTRKRKTTTRRRRRTTTRKKTPRRPVIPIRPIPKRQGNGGNGGNGGKWNLKV